MIFFSCPDYEKPSGGIRKIYRYVDILNNAGIDATVLHFKEGFTCSWFEHTTPVAWMHTATATPGDVVAIPEMFGRRINTMFPGLRKVILNQNCYMTFELFPLDYEGPYPYDDALAAIVVSEDSEEYVKLAFPRCRVLRIHYAIDPALFFFVKEKKRQLAYMPRKNEYDAKQVINILKARKVDCAFTPIHGVSETEAARILRESLMYLSFGHPEGFGLPAAEAMACGCVTVGYHGMGGREFFKRPYAHPVPMGDIQSYVKTVETLLNKDLEAERQAASEFILNTYTPERESESVLACWRAILDS